MVKKIIGVAMAMTLVAITLVIVVTTNLQPVSTARLPEKGEPVVVMPLKRVSRFLVEEENSNPRVKYHCHKDYRACYGEGSPGPSCCNNKCMDLKTDKDNCGACKNKCKYTESCCNGECVNLSFDKRHCGQCYNKCMPGGFCIYGMCDYA